MHRVPGERSPRARDQSNERRTLSAAACVFSVFSSRLVQVGDAAAVGAAGPGTVRVPFDRHSLTVPHSTTRALELFI